MYNDTYHFMADETKEFLTFDLSEDDKKLVLEQVRNVEDRAAVDLKAGKKPDREYTITYSKGEFYIFNGLIKGRKKYL